MADLLRCVLYRSAAQSWLSSFNCCPCILDRNSELEPPFFHISETLWASECVWEYVASSSHPSVANVPLSGCWC